MLIVKILIINTILEFLIFGYCFLFHTKNFRGIKIIFNVVI